MGHSYVKPRRRGKDKEDLALVRLSSLCATIAFVRAAR
jgi:hypothetical protein